MSGALDLLARHGAAIVFSVVLAGQAGLPVPAEPVLLAAGALAGSGRMNLAVLLGLAVAAGVLGDLVWYEVGRRKGRRVLAFLCQISLEPDTCVRRAEDLFAARGAWTLFFSKFVPGLTNAAPALAGITGMSPPRFVPLDAAATAVWAGIFAGVGFVFGHELERVEERASAVGAWVVGLVAAAFGLYVLWKVVQRQLYLRAHRLARITPGELHAKIAAGEALMIVDLRQKAEIARDPRSILGALRVDPDELERTHERIPRDREVILFCT